MVTPARQPTSREYSFLEPALAYARMNIPIFPLADGEKVPAIPKDKGGRGYLDATIDEATIRAWARDYPRANIGMPTGAVSGRVVIDEDPRNGGNASALYLPPTLTVRMPGGGRHFHYLHPGVPVSIDHKGTLGRGIDMQGEGAYVVLPPSVLKNGAVYAYEDEAQPIIELPARILVALQAKERVRQSGSRPGDSRPICVYDDADSYWLEKALAKTGTGTGDTTGYWLAQQLLCNNVPHPDDVLLSYAQAATLNPADPFDERSVQRWLDSARRSDLVQRGEPARSQTVIDARERFSHDQHNGHHQDDPAASEERGGESRGQERVQRGHKPQEPQHQDDEFWGKDLIGTHLRTELGNTRRLYDAHGRDIGYCEAFGFVVWNGAYWEIGAEMVVRHWAQDAIQGLYQEAAQLAYEASSAATDEDRNRLGAAAAEAFKWANRSQTEHMVKAMVALVRPYCLVEPDQFDAQPMLFNCRNGTIDLTTGLLRPHARGDFLMQCAPVEYHPDATAPTFLRFLREIMLDDGTRPERADLVAYLQRAFGYALTGDVSEQVWHLFVGKGGNGKTTLVEIIERVLGPYAGAMAPESVTITGRPRDGAAPSPDIAALKGKRFTTIPETEEGARLAPSRVKQLSGGDRVTARFLRRDLFTFLPTHKLFIHTNHRPEARETTHAFWRRVRYIPFDFTPPTGKDERLPAKLAAEAEGILGWLVEGCMEWQRSGLTPPKLVLDETEKYRADMDVLGTFIAERCILGPDEHERAKTLRPAWLEWCNENGERAGVSWGVRRFGMALTEKGFKQHTNNGVVWDGLRLRTVADPDPDPTPGATEGSEGSKVPAPTILPSTSPLHADHAEATEGTEANLPKKPYTRARKDVFLQVPSVPSVPSVDDDCEVTFVPVPLAGAVNGTSAHAAAPPPCPSCGSTRRYDNGPDVRCDHCDGVLVPGGAQQREVR